MKGEGTATDQRPNPDVTVVIPMHNRSALISYTLESLRAEHHCGVSLQVIVVDDGSTDAGPDMVECEFEWVLVIRQRWLGAPSARNRGLAHARGRTLLFLDSDDLVEPGFFGPRLAALSALPEAAGAYGPWKVFAGNGAFSPDRIQPRHSRYPLIERVESESHLTRLLRGWYTPGPSVLWRTQALRDVNGHDEKLRINQDVDLMFRILTSSPGIVGIDGPCALTRQHGGQRQGQVVLPAQVAQILDLRKRFKNDLQHAGRLDDENRRALAQYAFEGWAAWRLIDAESANGLLSLAHELWPDLPVRGGWMFRTLGAMIGPTNATLLKQHVQRLRVTLPLASK
jgi:glycosyltransferase involved in cell wall biosynthesis